MVNQTLLSEPSYANISQITKKKKKKKKWIQSLLYFSHQPKSLGKWAVYTCRRDTGTLPLHLCEQGALSVIWWRFCEECLTYMRNIIHALELIHNSH